MDVAPGADQHVIGAAEDAQATVCCHGTQVAGTQPVVVGQLRAMQVQPAVGIHPGGVTGQQIANIAGLPRLARGAAGDHRRRFGHAIARPQRPAGSQGTGVQCRRQRSPTDQRDAQRWRGRASGVEQLRQHRRHQRNVRDIAGMQIGHDRVAGETVVQAERGGGTSAAPEDTLAANVTERQASQPDIAVVQPEAGIGSVAGDRELEAAEGNRFGLAFAAAGGDEQCGVRRQVSGIGSGESGRAAVNRKKRPIPATGDIGAQRQGGGIAGDG